MEELLLSHKVRKIGKKYFGRCAVCGIQGELSKEHIPPRSAFNKGRYKIVKGIDILTENDINWRNNKNIKNKLIQGGVATYSLCCNCNNKTGEYYATAYKDFAYKIHSLFENNELKSNKSYKIKVLKVKPLNIIKQIISMFCSINPFLFKSRDFNIERFLLNKEDNIFCSGINFYLFLTQDGMVSPIQAVFHTDGSGKSILNSEISHYPIGIRMTIDSNPNNESCCINSFLNYKYDQEIDLEMNLFVRERITTIVGDYRTKEDFISNN